MGIRSFLNRLLRGDDARRIRSSEPDFDRSRPAPSSNGHVPAAKDEAVTPLEGEGQGDYLKRVRSERLIGSTDYVSANLDVRTVLRAEAGHPVSVETMARICRMLRVDPASVPTLLERRTFSVDHASKRSERPSSSGTARSSVSSSTDVDDPFVMTRTTTAVLLAAAANEESASTHCRTDDSRTENVQTQVPSCPDPTPSNIPDYSSSTTTDYGSSTTTDFSSPSF